MAYIEVFTDNLGVGTCRSCSAPMAWAEQVNGKKHPFNGKPSDLIFVKTGTAFGRPTGTVDTTVNTSHFATCPEATEFRRRR